MKGLPQVKSWYAGSRLRVSAHRPTVVTMTAADVIDLEFADEVWEWRGPAPYHFVSVPEELCDEVRDAAELVSYGWGMVPVTLRIGATEWTTSLWPKDGGYVVPLKDKVRRAESIELGDRVTVSMEIHLQLGRASAAYRGRHG